MGHSEVSMKEGDVVELLKIGCAGWWYVKILSKYLSWKQDHQHLFDHNIRILLLNH